MSQYPSCSCHSLTHCMQVLGAAITDPSALVYTVMWAICPQIKNWFRESFGLIKRVGGGE